MKFYDASCCKVNDGKIEMNLFVPNLPALIRIINTASGETFQDLPTVFPSGATMSASIDGIETDTIGYYRWTTVPKGDYEITTTDDSLSCRKIDIGTIGSPPCLELSYTVQRGLCGTEEVTISATAEGGNGDYTYTLTNGSSIDSTTGIFKGIPPSGTPYTLSVEDKRGCTSSIDILVTSTPTMTLVVGISKPLLCGHICDGEISVWVSGGELPYRSYLVDENSLLKTTDCEVVCPTFWKYKGLCAGTYTVYVEDSRGYIVQKDITLGAVAPIIATITTVGASCGDSLSGQICVDSITGGTPNYTLYFEQYPEWFTLPPPVYTDGTTQYCFTDLPGGRYVLIVEDAIGCKRPYVFGVAEDFCVTLESC